VQDSESPQGPIVVKSPGGELEIAIELKSPGNELGVPVFHVSFRGRRLIEDGRLGIDFAGDGSIGGGPLVSGLRAVRVERRRVDRTDRIFPGKTSVLRERFEEAVVALEESIERSLDPPTAPRRRIDVVVRAYVDGVAFRYRFPSREDRNDLRIAEERTLFAFRGDPRAYALPLDGFTTSYENYYTVGPLQEAHKLPLIALPLLLEFSGESAGGIWAAVTEADLTDYAGLYLKAHPHAPGRLEARLSPLPGRAGLKVESRAPHVSPWRVLMVADSPARLLESNLVLALNDPCAIADTSWIRPGKSTFPWWNGYEVGPAGFQGGLNTATMLHYIDFCAEQGIPYHSLDGFDTAWYGGPIVPYEGADITKSVPAIDLPAVLAHARRKGVRLRVWMHWEAAKRHMDRAFPIYEEWGIEGVMVDFLDRDDQEMVRFVHQLVKKAADHRLTVTLHGIHKPTGIRRTYPNLLTHEGVLNLEYDKWSKTGSSPEHELLVPFTRMLAGPLDYHQGGFRSVRPKDFAPRNVAPVVMGTRARMLAMYVVYEDPMPMMVDFPEAYRAQPGLGFVVRVPTVWDETRVLSARVGDSIAIARRRGGEWYVGAMTDGEAREIDLRLAFLGPGEHVAEVYSDPADANAPATALIEERFIVDAATVVQARLAPAGGHAMRITAASNPFVTAVAAEPAAADSTAGSTVLGIDGTRFTLNGKPTFLLGLSYYGGLGATEDFIRRDLDDASRHGFNWLRVWATWGGYDNDVSAVGADGGPREPFLGKLRWLIAECDRRGIVVDVTLARGQRPLASPSKPPGGRLPDLAAHRRAVETLVGELRAHRNWYLDLANERDVRDDRYVSGTELKSLRDTVRSLDAKRFVTASFGGHDLSLDDVRDSLFTIGLDFLSPHRPRDAESPGRTEAKTRESLTLMEKIGRRVPVHYQEPFRRGYARWEPVAADFLADLRGSAIGGAAGWCLHNGSQRNAPDEEPRRSFDLRKRRLFDQLDGEELKVVAEAAKVVREMRPGSPDPPQDGSKKR